MSLARLILNKSALCGLRVAVWDDNNGGYQDGLIEQFDTDHNCYIVAGSTERFAVQFHQFTVEEDGQQLVLKVFNCTRVQLPAIYSPVVLTEEFSSSTLSSRRQSTAPASRRQSGGEAQQQPPFTAARSSSTGEAAAAAAAAAVVGSSAGPLLQQLSSQSSELSDIVGASFSHTAAGYETVLGEGRRSSSSSTAGGQQQQQGGRSGSSSRYHSADGASGAPSRSTSMQGLPQGVPAAAAAAAAAQAIDVPSGRPAAGTSASSKGSEAGVLAEAEEEEEEEEGSEGALTAEGYWGSPLKQGGKARSPLSYAAEADGSGSEGEQEGATHRSSLAARLSRGSNSGSTAAAEGAPQAGPTPSGGFSASGLTSFKEISRKISSSGGISDLARTGSGLGDAAVDPATAAAAAAAVGLTLEDSSLALAAALDGVEVLPGSELQEGGGGGESDFTIGSVPDVSTRPSSGRLSRRSSRGLTPQEAPLTTHDGMMVDIPQPLTQRFRSNNSTRQPSWDSAQGAPHGGSGSSNNLGAAAGPGGSTGGAAAAGGDFQRSASGGGLRGEASGGGGSGASSRRMSRATSSRPTADQDWGLGAAAAAAATAAVAAAGPATGGAVVGELHVPGPTSRRTSRTLSGRLPPDQDATALPAVLGAGEQDVLPRPVTATDFAPSRRQSSAQSGGRPGTPDSDGFGFSEFEGVEPLVPPAAAAAQAAAAEAAVAAGVHAAAAAAQAAASSQLRRRSSRNIPHVPGVDPTHPGVTSGTTSHPDVAMGVSSAWGGPRPGGSQSHLEALQEGHQSGSKPSSSRSSLAGLGSGALSRQASRSLSQIKAAAVAAATALENFVGGVLAGRGDAVPEEDEQGYLEEAAANGILAGDSRYSALAQREGGGRGGSPLPGPGSSAHRQQQLQEEDSEAASSSGRVAYMDSFVTSPAQGGSGNPWAGAGEGRGDSMEFPTAAAAAAAGREGGLFAGSALFATPGRSSGGGRGEADSMSTPEGARISAWHLLEHSRGPLPPGLEATWGSGASLAKGGSYSSPPGAAADSPEGGEEVRGSASLLRKSLSLSRGGGEEGEGGSGVRGTSRLAKEALQALEEQQRRAEEEQEQQERPLNLPYSSSMRRTGPPSIHEITPAEEESTGDTSRVTAGAGSRRVTGGQSTVLPAAAAAVAVVPAALAAGAVALTARSSLDDLPPPPSYAESVAGDDAASSRAITPPLSIQGGPTAAAAGSASGGVRHGAQLEGAASLSGGSTLQMQSLTGQTWSNNGRGSEMLMLGMPAYAYEESDTMPLMMHGAKAMGYGAGQVHRTTAEARSAMGRIVLHCWLSAAAQHYCDFVFMCLGTHLIAAYLPPDWTPVKRLTALTGLYWAGHVGRPLGLAIWPRALSGPGRNKGVWAQAGIAGFATAFIGCMPNYSQGGMVGLVLAAALRLLLGVTQGSDTPGHLAYLADHAPPAAREEGASSLPASLAPMAAAGGALGAAGACLFFSWVLEGPALAFWGWRLPLVFGLVVQGVSALLRTAVLSSPEEALTAAEVDDRRLGHLGRVIRHHTPEVLLGVLSSAFGAMSFTIAAAFLPAYLIDLTSLPTHIALTTHSVCIGLFMALVPVGGLLVDLPSRVPFVMVACIVAAALAYPIWMLLKAGIAGVAWFGEFVLSAPGALALGAGAGVVAEAFPRGVRASALSLVACLTALLLSGGAPLMAAALVGVTRNTASPAAVTVLSAATSLLATWLLKRRGMRQAGMGAAGGPWVRAG